MEYFVFCNNCFRFFGEPSIFFIGVLLNIYIVLFLIFKKVNIDFFGIQYSYWVFTNPSSNMNSFATVRAFAVSTAIKAIYRIRTHSVFLFKTTYILKIFF